jgi:hypothetical protein
MIKDKFLSDILHDMSIEELKILQSRVLPMIIQAREQLENESKK